MLDVNFVFKSMSDYQNIKFKFEDLIIWQKAMDFGEEMNELSYLFPHPEKYNLSCQTRRAADSIVLNISEGSILQSVAEFRKFTGYSIRSLAEVVTCLHKARRRRYLNHEKFQLFYTMSFELMNKMIAFRKSIKN